MAKPQIIRGKIKILLTGGGSGGHIYPLLSVAQSLKRLAYNNGLDLSLDYLGPVDNNVKEAFEILGINIHSLLGSKVRKSMFEVIFIDLPKFVVSIFQAWIKMFFIMPDVVFSKGGTGSMPVVLSAWFYRVPIMIHESDAIPGNNNFFAGRHFAQKIAVSFENAKKYFDPSKTALTGNPVREELIYKRPQSADAKVLIGLDPQKPVIFVIGGSLGSTRINNFIIDNLRLILSYTQIIHQVGNNNFEEVKKSIKEIFRDEVSAQKSGYVFFPYLTENLKVAYSAADIVVSRAGAGALFEAASFSKPMILIPLPEAANDHQRANAYEFVNKKAAIVIEEENLLPSIFTDQIKKLLSNPSLLQEMGNNANNYFYKPDAADIIAKELIKMTGFSVI